MLVDLEEDLKEIVIKIRADGVPVSARVILSEMKTSYLKKYAIKSDEFDFLQRFAKYSSENDATIADIALKLFSDKWYSFSNEDEKIELNTEEKIILRDLLIKVQYKLVVLNLPWVWKFCSKYKRITHKSQRVKGELTSEILAFIENSFSSG